MKTLILTRHDVEKILTPAVANETVEKAFKAYSMGCAEMPAKSYLYFPKGDLRSMPAYISGEGFDIAGVKCVNVHPQNAEGNLPAVMAVIILNDPNTGFPLAVMDGTYLTCIRTGAAGAIAAKYLSREDSQVARDSSVAALRRGHSCRVYGRFVISGRSKYGNFQRTRSVFRNSKSGRKRRMEWKPQFLPTWTTLQ